MQILTVDPTTPEPDRIGRAAEILRGGGLVAFPTETVYGLGANALDEVAVARIYEAKGRPEYNPLIVHVADDVGARRLVTEWPDSAARLAAAFWPGPLTLVLPRDPRVPAVVSAGLDTVAVRVPAHPVALALLRAAGLAIVAPSANPSMSVSPTRAEHVVKGLGDRVDLILDAGATGVGIESTVVDLSGERAAILRPGAVSIEELTAVLGEVLGEVHEAGREADGAKPGGDTAPRPSPGMLDRHYAPRAELRLFDAGAARDAVARARKAARDGLAVGALVLDPAPFSDAGEAFRAVVPMPRDAAGYARELYATLHRMDDLGCDLLLVEAVPRSAAWAAVRDRLARAAG